MSTSRTVIASLVAFALFACTEPKREEQSAPRAEPSPPAVTAAVAPTPSAPVPPAAEYDLDASHSRVGFSVRHMMVSNTRGHFSKLSGAAHIDERDLAASRVSIDVDTASIDTADAKRDEHLRSADFFDVKAHPTMTFRSTSVRAAGAGYAVAGELTIRGVTKPVVLEVDALSPPVKDPWGGVRRGTRARAKIDRKAWGLTWNKALETGGVAVGDEVTLDLEIELIQKKPS